MNFIIKVEDVMDIIAMWLYSIIVKVQMKILLKILHFYYLTITDLPGARLTRIDFHNIG